MEEEEERKGERKERGKKEKEKRRKKKNCAWERKSKNERGKEKIFPVFQQLVLDSPRTKVGPCNESYVWVSKSEVFVEAPRGRGFLLYWFLFI